MRLINAREQGYTYFILKNVLYSDYKLNTMLNKTTPFIFLLIALTILSSISCKGDNKKKLSKETMELVLVGFPEQLDVDNITKMGAQAYFCYEKTDTISIKSCSYLNDITGEPIVPVTCEYGKLRLKQEQKDQFDYFINLAKTTPSGELNTEPNKECYCDLFGLWLAIYTSEYNSKKYYIFDCCNIPDSVYSLCSQLHWLKVNGSLPNRLNNIFISTDSIVDVATGVLSNEIKKRRERLKRPSIKNVNSH